MASSTGSPYQPLEQSDRHFRLLRLRGSDTCQTHCEMKTFSLLNDELPSWKALSYRWGEDEPSLTISLNDYPVPVRKGLHAFLAQMIVETRQDWYFIDALCIDQRNDLEKSFQVQQMREVYQRAEEVVVWIVYEPWHYESDSIFQVVYDTEEDAKDISSLSPARLQGAILENSYWSRLWILQEVLLAKRLAIRIGGAEVEWSTLLPEKIFSKKKGSSIRNESMNASNVWHARQLYQHSTKPSANRTTAHNILLYRRFMTKALRAGYHLPFHRAMDFFSMQRCSRPHDAVFGYLGLTNSRMQIDYSIPILDLFITTLAEYLLSAGFIRRGLTRFQFKRLKNACEMANDVIPPLLAFGLNPCEPVVHLLLLEVTKFFAPGFESCLTDMATEKFRLIRSSQTHEKSISRFFTSEHKFGFRKIGSLFVKLAKFWMSESNECRALQKEMSTRMKRLKTEDAVMPAPGESVESKTYSQWVAHARAISEQIFHRFVKSGQDAEENMNGESWTLIA